MIHFGTVPESAKELLISTPSYYRLSKIGLVPPPVRISGNRSAVPTSEIEAVKAARLAGKDDHEIRSLIKRLVESRKSAPVPTAA